LISAVNEIGKKHGKFGKKKKKPGWHSQGDTYNQVFLEKSF
jgi:hypothetical protein